MIRQGSVFLKFKNEKKSWKIFWFLLKIKFDFNDYYLCKVASRGGYKSQKSGPSAQSYRASQNPSGKFHLWYIKELK